LTNAVIEKWGDHLGKPDVYQEDEKGLGTTKMKLRKCSWAGSDTGLYMDNHAIQMFKEMSGMN
jgi:hypothetical protein